MINITKYERVVYSTHDIKSDHLDHIELTNDVRFYRCEFEGLTIHDHNVTDDIFVECYFENVTFDSGKHITGIDGCFHNPKALIPDLEKKLKSAKHDLFLRQTRVGELK